MSKTLETSVSEQTYQAVLETIINRVIDREHVIEERKLAERLGVSRTPLRAALNRLIGEGIVKRLSNGSVVVKPFEATELLELLNIRLLLEPEAAFLATKRIPTQALETVEAELEAVLEQSEISAEQDWTIDNLVHDLVIRHCPNRSLVGLITDLRLKSRLCNVETLPGRALHARQEHLQIIKSLSTGLPEKARDAMHVHLSHVRDAYMHALGYIK